MAVTITATAGSASANSFITLVEAQAFMDARLNSTKWDSATTDNQNRALVEATRELSALRWQGNRTDTTQVLSWPRFWAVDPDSPTSDYFASTVIPQRIKDATAELAFQFLKAGTNDIASLDATVGVIEKTIDVITTRYSEFATKPKGLERFPSVMRYIRALLAAPSGVNVPTVRS